MDVRTYILEQPDALRAVFLEIPERVRPIAKGLVSSPPSRVILVGSGTSRHALMAVHPGLERALPCTVTVCGPLEFLRQRRQANDCVVVLSQSGSSTTSVEVLRQVRSDGIRHVAVTAEPGSALARTAEESLILPIGPEVVGPKTKGYTASVAALLCLQWEAEAARDGITQAHAAAAAETCNRLSDLMGELVTEGEALARNHRAVRHVLVLGQGRHVATALEGSLKVVEMSGVPACGVDTEEALHGWFHALREDDLAIFIAGNDDEAALAQGAARVLGDLRVPSRVLTAARVLTVLPKNAPRECDLFALIIPLQALALTLAVLRGTDPNRMPYPGLSARLGIKSPPQIPTELP